MLVVTREPDQTVIIDGNIRITVKSIHKGHVKFHIDAPKDRVISKEKDMQEKYLKPKLKALG